MRKNLIHSLCLVSIIGYAFLADFLAVFGFTPAKLVFASSTLLFALILCVSQYNKLRLKIYLFLPFAFLLLYVFVFRNTNSLSYFYTAILAFFFIQDDAKAKKYLDCLFVLQFLLVLYEVLTQNLIYSNIVTGLFSTQEVEIKTELFDESGFRAKGMFTGCLEATSFAIGYTLISRNSIKRSFWSLIMAVSLNGRMAMFITFAVFVYNLVIYARMHRVSKGTVKIVFVSLSIVLISALITISSTSQKVSHLLSAFNPESNSFMGRTVSYALAAEEYFVNYGLKQKLIGSEYELIRITDGREMSAESDILGILLEIGLVGFIYIIGNVLNAYRRSSEKLFESDHISFKFAILCMVLCMIEYRYANGNVRGILFWLLIISSSVQNKKQLYKKYLE